MGSLSLPTIDQQKPDALEQERKLILREYRALMRSARPYLQDEDAKHIKAAFNLAQEAHQDVRRKSGEPYILHPLAVARIVVEEMGLGTTAIIGALLHDVVEDTEIPLEEIEAKFGKKVSRIIDGLTKVPDVKGRYESAQAETFRKVLVTISQDIRVVLIKIADRLHNMRTLDGMPRDKQLKTRSETRFVYAPLAHRLGLYNIKSELEDLSLKYAKPEVYHDIQQKIDQSKRARDRFVREFVKPIEAELQKQGFTFEIKQRVKSISSIWNKMQKQKIPFEEVYDLFAIRIILEADQVSSEKSLCWQAYSIVSDLYTPNTKRLRDWISVPRANGYESLHTTVMSPQRGWVEVQIRTRRMDDIAEKGYAAHWKYKGVSERNDRGIEVWLNRVRESIENKDMDALEFMQEFRNNLFSDEVYAFTPKGDIKVLPKGATILDFAFSVHSQIGLRCMGGKVGHKLVSLSYEIQNGDQIDILKASQIKANTSWLRMTHTAKARNHIRQYLRKEQRQTQEQGKEIIARKLQQLKMPFDDQTVAQLVDFFDTKTATDLYQRVGQGRIPHTEIKKFKDAIHDKQHLPDTAKKAKEIIKAKHQRDMLIVGADPDIDYTLSPCCKPILGDDIFGYVTAGQGIKIHRIDCPNAVQMMSAHGDRIISAIWAGDARQRYDIGLRIVGTDRMGLINDISREISEQHRVNIVSMNIGQTQQTTGLFEGLVVLSVLDKGQMDSIAKRLQAIEGVVSVFRDEE
ncbi:MAG: RelA/SpoT family protein [Bernardetiaceae bacterium]